MNITRTSLAKGWMRMLIKEKMQVMQCSFSLEDIAKSLCISIAEASEKFKDARITGPFAEIWGTKIYRFQRHANSNFPGSDGKIILGPIGRYNISVRSFCRRISFQRSKFIGGGRGKCTQENLMTSLEEVEKVIAVDIRDFPTIIFYPIDSKWLLRFGREGRLTPTGMTAKIFENWIYSTFDVEITAVDNTSWS